MDWEESYTKPSCRRTQREPTMETRQAKRRRLAHDCQPSESPDMAPAAAAAIVGPKVGNYRCNALLRPAQHSDIDKSSLPIPPSALEVAISGRCTEPQLGACDSANNNHSPESMPTPGFEPETPLALSRPRGHSPDQPSPAGPGLPPLLLRLHNQVAKGRQAARSVVPSSPADKPSLSMAATAIAPGASSVTGPLQQIQHHHHQGQQEQRVVAPSPPPPPPPLEDQQQQQQQQQSGKQRRPRRQPPRSLGTRVAGGVAQTTTPAIAAVSVAASAAAAAVAAAAGEVRARSGGARMPPKKQRRAAAPDATAAATAAEAEAEARRSGRGGKRERPGRQRDRELPPEADALEGGGGGGGGGGSGGGPQRLTDPRVSTWTPPASPWGLIEEALYDNPWRLLVACILLNRTTGRQVRQVLGPLWRAYPTPEAMARADPRVIADIVRPLGLQTRRAARLVRFSDEFMNKQWTCPSQLHGVGRYAADAYLMFCRGRWREVQPEDKDLRRYRDWLQATGGEGSGLDREDLAAVLQGAQELGVEMVQEEEEGQATEAEAEATTATATTTTAAAAAAAAAAGGGG
ncbi:hypothetical protein PLESTB_001814400 [Pleodorina starrii]|uniref:Methyl-CpG-binding domain protein 4 n=1 Tax=Pleodorina starrii TaxID=330485 RepID=A0A9W6C0U0_9CHLO|nr:hypothetical protein PLESTB_001814400 [Pleodorina starrii]GLC75916.1 hypothetical protein PLESTF_001705700 [Pleodorina starrii]